jgi:hypothetical protein
MKSYEGLIQYDWCPSKKRKRHQRCLYTKGHGSYIDKTSIYRPKRAAPGEAKSSNTLILDFQPPDLWENTLLLLKTLNLWRTVQSALVN